MSKSFSKIRHIQNVNLLLEDRHLSNKSLLTERTLELGSKGDDVKKMQRALGIEDDGIFGKDTKTAVINFQRKNGLVPDGVVGPLTQKKLFNTDKVVVPKTTKNYPYDKLLSNPSSEFIANIIKSSYGGLVGNDKEAWAQAAFSAIKSKEQYANVKKYLGEDPYEFIKSFMDTDEQYHRGLTVDQKYTKLLGKTVKDKKDDEKSSITGYVIPFAFPEYEPKVDGKGSWAQFLGWVSNKIAGGEKEGTYGKLGHAGVATVTMGGNVQLFEFGRYKSAEKGIAIKTNLGNIAKIINGKITNLDSLINIIHRNTQGDGPSEKIEYAVLPAPNIEGGIDHARSVTEKDYAALDFSISNEQANCATFAIEVVKASGIPVEDFCFPTPISMIAKMKSIEDPFYINYKSLR